MWWKALMSPEIRRILDDPVDGPRFMDSLHDGMARGLKRLLFTTSDGRVIELEVAHTISIVGL